MKHPLILIAAISLPLLNAAAQWPTAEHLIYVRIESTPDQATLTTVPTKEGEAPLTLGKTPLVVPVELNWDTKRLRKRWELIHTATRHGIATNTYDPADKTHTITFTYALEKEGHQRQIIQQVAAVLPYDERADGWDELLKTLPARRTLTHNLIPLTTSHATTTAPSTALPEKKAIPTIIVARGTTADAAQLGYATIDAPVGTPILANGIHAGTAPLRLALPAGENKIGTTDKAGKPAPPQTITIEVGKTTSVTLSP